MNHFPHIDLQHNRAKRPEDLRFVADLETGIVLAQHWGVICPAGLVMVSLWQFCQDEPVGDGVVTVDRNKPPSVVIQGCTFRNCSLGVLDTIFALMEEWGVLDA